MTGSSVHAPFSALVALKTSVFWLRHRGTIIKRANRYIAFRGEESTVAENKEYFPEKNKEYSNKYKKKISAYKKNFEVLFRAHFFFTQSCTSCPENGSNSNTSK